MLYKMDESLELEPVLARSLTFLIWDDTIYESSLFETGFWVLITFE